MNRARSSSVWSRWLPVWLSAAVFLILNLGAFLVYRTVFAGEVAVSQEAVEREQSRLDELEADARRLEGFLGRVDDNRQRMAELYTSGFSTEPQRMTEILREVKRLAREANLEPRATSYPEETLEEYGLSKRSFVFSVEGTYFDLRKLINSLELSDYFLTLEDVALSESGGRGAGTRLRINLRLSTLFDSRDKDGGSAAVGRKGAT